jgi:hypothetical protein
LKVFGGNAEAEEDARHPVQGSMRSPRRDLVQHVLLSVLQALRAGRFEEPTRLDAYVLGT